ncbi:kinase-like domain-containing protein [Xylaria sp. FL0933]|nr:kinase-like domain-containing protein [Xylaria sp. FL0933]
MPDNNHPTSNSGSPTNPHTHSHKHIVASPTADIPNTAGVIESKHDNDEDQSLPLSLRFLTLSPDNDLACDVMAGCAASITTADPIDSYKHHQQFLETVELDRALEQAEAANKPGLEASPSLLPPAWVNGSGNNPRDENPTSRGKTNTLEMHPIAPDAVTRHHRFVLDLSQAPTGPHRSWIIGPGTSKLSDKNKHRGVDLLLKPTQSTVDILPAPFIALIWIHPESGAFMLKTLSSRCPIQYLSGLGSKGDLVLEKGEQTVMWMRRNRLRFGLRALDFVVDVAINPQDASFTLKRNQFLLESASGQDADDNGGEARPARGSEPAQTQILPHESLDPIPQDSHSLVNGIVIHSKVMAAGTFGRVSSGVQASTGKPIAVKIIRSTRTSELSYIQNEIRIAQLLSPHRNIVPFISVWCSCSAAAGYRPCFNSPLDDYHMIMPLAACALSTFFSYSRVQERGRDEVNERCLRLRLLRDAMEGLQHMHSHGIMHRDISPNNLLVFYVQPGHADTAARSRSRASGARTDTEAESNADMFPWRAAICDFGKAIREERHHETSIGPVHTVAPEVWTLLPPHSTATALSTARRAPSRLAQGQLRQEEDQRTYTNKIDIWSLGYTHLYLLLLAHWPLVAISVKGQGKTDKRRQESLIGLLDELCAEKSIGEVERRYVASLLALDPGKRPCAKKALEHAVWEGCEKN